MGASVLRRRKHSLLELGITRYPHALHRSPHAYIEATGVTSHIIPGNVDRKVDGAALRQEHRHWRR